MTTQSGEGGKKTASPKANRKQRAARSQSRTKIFRPPRIIDPQVEVPKELQFLIAVRAGLALLRHDLNRKPAK